MLIGICILAPTSLLVSVFGSSSSSQLSSGLQKNRRRMKRVREIEREGERAEQKKCTSGRQPLKRLTKQEANTSFTFCRANANPTPTLALKEAPLEVECGMSPFCVLSECCQSVCEYECGVLYGTGYDSGCGSGSGCGSWCLCWLLNSALLKAKADFLSAIMMRTFCARVCV